MRSRLLALLLVAAAAAPAAVLAQSNTYGRVPAVRFVVQSEPIIFGDRAVLIGAMNKRYKGTVILLQSRDLPNGTYKNVTTTKVNKNGKFGFIRTPSVSTVYRAIAGTKPRSRSPEVRVRVRIKVGIVTDRRHLTKAGRIRFHGSVRPAHNGREASIQRRSPAGRWKRIARTRLRAASDNRSTYSRRIRIKRSGFYRVVVKSDGDHINGLSRPIKIVIG